MLHWRERDSRGFMFSSVLQSVAVCCSALQCVAVEREIVVDSCVAVRYSALQSVALCYSVLNCVAVCRSVLQCAAACCRGSLILSEQLSKREGVRAGQCVI